MNRDRREPKSVNLDDLDWVRLLIGVGGRRLDQQVIASLKVTTAVRLTHAEKIDALLLIAARGVRAAERIATCMERSAVRPRSTRAGKRRAAVPRKRRRS